MMVRELLQKIVLQTNMTLWTITLYIIITEIPGLKQFTFKNLL